MGALTKADLAEHLFEKVGLNKREAKELVEEYFEAIRTDLESGCQVKLSGFGNFNLRDKEKRQGVILKRAKQLLSKRDGL